MKWVNSLATLRQDPTTDFKIHSGRNEAELPVLTGSRLLTSAATGERKFGIAATDNDFSEPEPPLQGIFLASHRLI